MHLGPIPADGTSCMSDQGHFTDVKAVLKAPRPPTCLPSASKTPPSPPWDLPALIWLALSVSTGINHVAGCYHVPLGEPAGGAGAFFRANSAFACEMRVSLWLYSALAALSRSRDDIEDWW